MIETYDLRMTTSYSYGAPVTGGRHVLRLLLPDLAGRQQVLAEELTISPGPDDLTEARDFFGNRTTTLTLAGAHAETEVTLRARVSVTMPIVPRTSPRLGELPALIHACRRLDPAAPHHFLPPSPRVAPQRLIRDWVVGLTDPGLPVLEQILRINFALHRLMQFDSEATDVETPAEVAFVARRGVCQDFSHILIGALREIGIPAGYVSGFLRTLPPPGQPRLEGADAMHAWVMAWCGPDAGWVEVDPTNAILVGSDHVLVARGRDYSDVAPVRGVLWTTGGQSTRQAVDIIPLGRTDAGGLSSIA